MKKDNKQKLFEVMGRLDKTFKLRLNENVDDNKWSDLIDLKNNDTFTRDELKRILYKIYKSVYLSDKQKMLELIEFFGFDDIFTENEEVD